MEDINVRVLEGFSIILLGYWVIPEDSTAEASREAHETEAEAVLYELAAQFSHGGVSTDVQLHFGDGGPEMQDLQASIVEKADPDGILRATELTSINNVLVPLRDDRHKDDLIEFVSAFDTDSIFVAELYHAVPEERAVKEGEEVLSEIKDGLLALEFTEDDLETTVEVVEDPLSGIAAKARAHNIVVVGETEEINEENRVFGPVSEYILDETNTSVIIVR